MLLATSDSKEFIMCIPHGATGTKSNGYIDTTPPKSVKRVSKAVFEHGDPNYKDEVIEYHKPKPKKNFFEKLLGL